MKTELTTVDLKIIESLEQFPNTKKLEYAILLNGNDETKLVLKERMEWLNQMVLDMKNLFTENEWNFLMDISNGEDIPTLVKVFKRPISELSDPSNYSSDIWDSIEYRDLGVKWNVSGDDICGKIMMFSSEKLWNLRLVLSYLWDNDHMEFIEQVRITEEV